MEGRLEGAEVRPTLLPGLRSKSRTLSFQFNGFTLRSLASAESQWQRTKYVGCMVCISGFGFGFSVQSVEKEA